jgi:hypothetical protein
MQTAQNKHRCNLPEHPTTRDRLLQFTPISNCMRLTSSQDSTPLWRLTILPKPTIIEQPRQGEIKNTDKKNPSKQASRGDTQRSTSLLSVPSQNFLYVKPLINSIVNKTSNKNSPISTHKNPYKLKKGKHSTIPITHYLKGTYPNTSTQWISASPANTQQNNTSSTHSTNLFILFTRIYDQHRKQYDSPETITTHLSPMSLPQLPAIFESSSYLDMAPSTTSNIEVYPPLRHCMPV